jgi:hypothetical protein
MRSWHLPAARAPSSIVSPVASRPHGQLTYVCAPVPAAAAAAAANAIRETMCGFSFFCRTVSFFIKVCQLPFLLAQPSHSRLPRPAPGT